MVDTWKSNVINVNDMRMHYDRTGNGEKPSLVLVHGFSDNGMCWAKTARKLEDRYDIVMPDSRGHGLSARVQPGDEIDNAGDLAALIQQLELDQPIIAGHSMGASSVSELAVRFPELPKALILEDPPWRDPAPLPEDNKTGESIRPALHWVTTLVGKTLEQVIEEYRPQHPSWEEDVLRAWCLGKVQLDQNFLDVQRLFRMSWREIVKGIQCPTLLISADAPGGIVSDDIAQKAVEINTYVNHVHISGTGHHIRFENFADYFEAFNNFLSQL
ncbi:MAG: alpha/beta hydrolase [Anaerolineae bacterium]|nr:alpha/beta hydrolase [Anaerolineae bacterium]